MTDYKIFILQEKQVHVEAKDAFREGANKQVIFKADSLIKFSDLDDFCPANIESTYLGYFFHHFWCYFRFYEVSHDMFWSTKQVGRVNNIASWFIDFTVALIWLS